MVPKSFDLLSQFVTGHSGEWGRKLAALEIEERESILRYLFGSVDPVEALDKEVAEIVDQWARYARYELIALLSAMNAVSYYEQAFRGGDE